MRYGIVADSISIHALREEGDKRELHPRRTSRNFYPRPPRGGRPINHAILKAKFNFYPRPPRGGRRLNPSVPPRPRLFLSTPSARRATASNRLEGREKGHFYPRPPRGGRPPKNTGSVRPCDFYPRPPRGGRPLDSWHYGDNYTISIHALREEGDLLIAGLSTFWSHFYPRPPRGGRPMWPWRRISMIRFLSTPSARRATICQFYPHRR